MEQQMLKDKVAVITGASYGMGRTIPSLSFPLKKGIHKNKIHFFRNFLIFPKIFRSR